MPLFLLNHAKHVVWLLSSIKHIALTEVNKYYFLAPPKHKTVRKGMNASTTLQQYQYWQIGYRFSGPTESYC